MQLDPEECAVHCSQCNGYLYATSIYDNGAQGQQLMTVNCPYQCRKNGDGTVSMKIPDGEQRYGRS